MSDMPDGNPDGAEDASAARLEAVRSRIAAAAVAAGRKPSDVCLVAVSKTFGAAEIEPVLSANQRVFGENRVQEAAAKWPGLKAHYADIELHLIGPLQTNKARDAIALFDVIETLDRPKLAHALHDAARVAGRCPRLFVQVNTGDEPQKAGVGLGALEDLLSLARSLDLPVEGLMCIPPVEEEPALHFALLAKLAARHGLASLSMGMSGDFETAIALGATHVRVGSAIFGTRTLDLPGTL